MGAEHPSRQVADPLIMEVLKYRDKRKIILFVTNHQLTFSN